MGDEVRAEPRILSLSGELDLATSAALAVAFDGLTDGSSDVVVDLADVEFVDASTIGALVRAGNELRAQSRHLVVRSPSPCASRVLELCGLLDLVEPVASTNRGLAPAAMPAR